MHLTSILILSGTLHRVRKKAWRSVCFNLQPRRHSSLPAPNLQPTANQERNDQYAHQHHSRELLMMGMVMPETWAYKKYNKTTSVI
jgi:hypothetical protein